MNTEKKYDVISSLYDSLEIPFEKFVRKYRRKLISKASGHVLEVGIGTGKNLPYYPVNMNVTGIDFSAGMLEKAEKRKRSLRMEHVSLYKMDVEALPFAENSFDSVVSTFVFCTVPYPEKGLMEIYRVLKPGGRALFLEHMKSGSRTINVFLNAMNLFSSPLTGTSMIRETEKSIVRAGFRIEEEENIIFDVLKIMEAVKK